MKENYLLKESGVVSIIVLFICASFVPSISGYSEDADQVDIDVADVCELQEDVIVTCRTFGFPGEPTQEITMSLTDAESLYDKIKELQIEVARDPLSDKTLQLQHEIITLADEHDLLPAGLSPDTLTSRLHPSWTLQNRRLETLPLPSKGSELFCTFVSTGSGGLLPIIVLPRLIPIIMTPIPRLFMIWNADEAITSCGGLRSGTGFIAYGQQNGIALGFWGIGFTFSLPPFMGVYGLAGYALFARVNAEEIEFYPPNRAPIISSENPSSGTWDVPASLSELSFRIDDADGDLMSYSVTTDPDIGSGSGNNKKNGFYSVPVSGLDYDKIYRWKVEVTDGKDTTVQQFSFFTEAKPPFDPFDEGWQYRKKITIDHTKVAGDLTNFPVLVSATDTDLRDRAQADGDDILFMGGTGVATKLYHEIEEYDDSSGKLIAWVNVPSISGDGDTVFYMYYGNPSCNSQQFSDKTWNAQFKAVWHLHESPTGTIHDSTLNDNDGTSYGGMSSSDLVDGMVSKCIDFDGDDDYISTPDSSSLKPESVTLAAWFRPLEEDVPNGYVVSKSSDDTWGNADGHTYGFGFRLGKDGSTWIDARFERDTTAQQHEHAGHYYTTNNEWHHLTLTFDGNTNNAHFYVNGVLNGTVPSCHSTVLWYPDAWDFLMGASKQHEGSSHAPNIFFKCRIDEVRVLNTAVDASWVSTEYNNQNDPSSFLGFGPEEAGP